MHFDLLTCGMWYFAGDIFGCWVKGFDSISMEMTNLVVKSLTYLNPFQSSSAGGSSSSSAPHSAQLIQGPAILSSLLPRHSDLPQIYLLLSASLLGCQCTDIPFNARFDMETLEEVFRIGEMAVVGEYRVCGEAACVLLTVARTLLHKVRVFLGLLTLFHCVSLSLSLSHTHTHTHTHTGSPASASLSPLTAPAAMSAISIP